MSNRSIRMVIVLGVISLLSILVIQLFWIKKNIEFQEKNIELQQRQDSISIKQFNDNVTVALKNVATEIQRINQQPGDLYGNVRQLTPNYFTVELQDTVMPYLLETLLKKEFYHQNVEQDFQYGIYDCYLDSIIYGNYIRFVDDSTFITDFSKDAEKLRPALQIKLNSDAHYFTVFFPKIGLELLAETPDAVTPWYYLFAVILVVLVFFSFSVSVILKQKKLSEIKNDFINNMTHELKTPIATIRISSETLLNLDQQKDESDKLQRYAGIIYKENKRLEQQVERVLNIAKLDKHEIKLKIEVFCIHEIIEEAKENFEFNQLEETGGKISIDLAATEHLVEADVVHVTNVIYNLLDNAVKYCEITPAIRISTRNAKNKIYITVTDNGKGISRENQKYVFDKFYRVSTGNLHDVKGFGLGLYYVKTITEQLGGSVDVKSSLGKGSEFTVSFPVKTITTTTI
ncbi:MAG: HAMP domain-containing histidine kinase [Crocinitomicaceae bacterium]|nr:HAMP domain-containing histidine kinase [Crocinitomicaceae bacterium]MBK8924748.1 HAMP domain-containing histidine kinase [Crocinitomicaceae bacterium]